MVSTEQAQSLSKQYNSPLIEASAKSNTNVTLAFETLITKVITTNPPPPPAPKMPLQPVTTPADKCSAACQK